MTAIWGVSAGQPSGGQPSLPVGHSWSAVGGGTSSGQHNSRGALLEYHSRLLPSLVPLSLAQAPWYSHLTSSYLRPPSPSLPPQEAGRRRRRRGQRPEQGLWVLFGRVEYL